MSKTNQIGAGQDYAALGKITVSLLRIAVAVGASAYRGYVLLHLWRWFFTPTFGIAVPSIAMCIGIAMTARLILNPPKWEKETPESKAKKHAPAEELVLSFVFTTVVWAIGWLLSLIA